MFPPVSLSLGLPECGEEVRGSGAVWASGVSTSCLEGLLVACAGSTPRLPRDRFISVLGRNTSSSDDTVSM